MTKNELLRIIASRTNLPKSTVDSVLNEFQNVVLDTMDPETQGVSIPLTKLGSFQMKLHKQRNGVNPSTGEKIIIAPYKTIMFKAFPSLKKPI